MRRRLPHPPASAGERGAGTGCGNPGTKRRRRGGGDHSPGRLAPGLQPIPAAEQADARPNRSPSVLGAPALFFESSRCLPEPCPLPARPYSSLPRAAWSELRSGLSPLRTYRVISALAPTTRWFPPGLSGDMTSALSRRVALCYDDGRERVLSSLKWFLFEQHSSSPVLPL